MTATRKSPQKLSRHKLLKGAASAAVLGTLQPLSFPAIAQQTKVRYTLSWLPTGQYAFVYSPRPKTVAGLKESFGAEEIGAIYASNRLVDQAGRA